jgi:OOP family OmpA-OmpF porin
MRPQKTSALERGYFLLNRVFMTGSSAYRQTVIAIASFIFAGVLAILAAWLAAFVIEARSAQAVRSQLLDQGMTWIEVSADGLQVQLSGTAPNEAARFRAVNLAGSVIDSNRVRDSLEVPPVKAIEAPRFSIEMLRNDDGIQLIGLLPEGETKDLLLQQSEGLTEANAVADMLETADYPAPEGWDDAFSFGIEALRLLPRAKVSVSAGRVAVTAIADSEAEKRRHETELARMKPDGLALFLDITSPRPVLTPFTLRFVIDAQGPRFDACSADTDRARDRILAAGVAAGVTGKSNCTVGLGVPTPRWAEAAGLGIGAVKSLGVGTITFSDADVSLAAPETVSQEDFDRVVGELQSALPEVFSLNVTLERKATAPAAGPAVFTAKLEESGQIELRGRLTDERLRDAVSSFAQARFGVDKVYTATRLDEDLPDGWSVRVLAGLESMAELAHGNLLVRADTVEISGVTGSQTARARISQILSNKLGQGEQFKVAVTYDKDLDPLAALPTPQECADEAATVLSKSKITFPPGSAEIDGQTATIMDALAKILEDCATAKLEIAGYTDSQGSEEGNRALSQARAEAVLLALQGRGVDVANISAKGYGEANPIADNDTDAGREANRRIEFALIGQPAAAVEAAPSEGATAPQTAPSAPSGEATAAAPSAAGPDFSDDDSPSVAPTEKTRRPLARPVRDG